MVTFEIDQFDMAEACGIELVSAKGLLACGLAEGFDTKEGASPLVNGAVGKLDCLAWRQSEIF